MLVLNKWQWAPEHREKLQEIALSSEQRAFEVKSSDRVKILGRWHDISGNAMFVLMDVKDPMTLLAGNEKFLKYATVESFNVVEDKQLIKMANDFRMSIEADLKAEEETHKAEAA